MTDEFRARALEYHRHPVPGKLQIQATKRMVNQLDLALAYSPGVAVACEEIVDNPSEAAAYTTRGNLVGVVTNGTAVLGLGPIGPLASTTNSLSLYSSLVYPTITHPNRQNAVQERCHLSLCRRRRGQR